MARRLSSPVFVGRSQQIESLNEALARATSGEPEAIFLAGEAGVGKTRLVSEFEQLAIEAGAQFLIGGCVDVGGSELPYAPLLGALRILVGTVEPEALEELAGASAGELRRLLPEIAAGPEPAATEPNGNGLDPLAQSRLFEGLLGLLGRAGRQAPVVLVIEDLHWADPSTRGFLSFLLRNVRRERLMLVTTYRSDELHRRHPLREFLSEVERLPVVERLELRPFTRDELSEQLATIRGEAPEPELVDLLLERSQGNPFFAEELLAAATEQNGRAIPSSVRDVVTMRIERVSPTAKSLVHRAAVVGTGAGHRLLEAITGLDAEDLVQALREAIEHSVLVPDASGTGYAFRHALLRETLYEELLPHERVTLHAEVARALEADPSLAVGPRGAAAQRAMHWSSAKQPAPALTASIQAATEDERVWAFAEAVGHLERAVELWEEVSAEQRPADTSKAALLARAAEAAHLSGDNRRAMALTRRELGLLDQAVDPVTAGVAHARLGRYLLAEEGAARQALTEYQTAAALVGEEFGGVRASILAGEAHIMMLRGQALEAREPCEEAIRLARAAGDRAVECDALNTLGGILVILGDQAQAAELLREAMEAAESLAALEQLRRSYINLGEALEQLGSLDEAAKLTRDGWERLRQPLGASALFLAAEAGLRFLRLGNLDTAETLLREAMDLSRDTPFTGMVLAAMVELAAIRGDVDQAEAHLRAAVPLIPRHSDWPIVHARAAAVLAIARGDFEAVRSLLDTEAAAFQAGHSVFALPVLALGLQAEADLAQRARAVSDADSEQVAQARSQALLEQVRQLTAAETWPLGSAPAKTVVEQELCELEHGRAFGRPDSERWSALADRWQELARPFDAAYARMREAESALTEQLPRERVAEALMAARTVAEQLKANPLLAQVELLARRARIRGGESEQQARDGDQGGLTDRELDVLRLVVAGHTNREIGQALYMSPKTASVHVSRILAKLEVRTRAEAAGAAYRLGLLDTGRPDVGG